MQRRRFTNPAQPQTLVIAVFLLYMNSVLLLFQLLQIGAFPLEYMSLVIGGACAGYGIANEKKWGYGLGIVMSILPFGLAFWRFGDPFAGASVFSLMFDIALIALLLHPESRNYQRIWFK